jgi:hypothetical protein
MLVYCAPFHHGDNNALSRPEFPVCGPKFTYDNKGD